MSADIEPFWYPMFYGVLLSFTVRMQKTSYPRSLEFTAKSTQSLMESPQASVFNVQEFLESAGVSRNIVSYRKSQKIYSQGDAAENVMYLQKGTVNLSVVSEGGKEAVVAIFRSGDFFGEGAIAGQNLRIGTATAAAPTTLLVIGKKEMTRVLHEEHAFSDLFVAFILSRNIRMEEDLIDHLFNSSEKRLARTLLLLARYGNNQQPLTTLPKISQETLAKMIGTSRGRVNLYMNKFRKLGFVRYKGTIQVNPSLLNVVLQE